MRMRDYWAVHGTYRAGSRNLLIARHTLLRTASGSRLVPVTRSFGVAATKWGVPREHPAIIGFPGLAGDKAVRQDYARGDSPVLFPQAW